VDTQTGRIEAKVLDKEVEVVYSPKWLKEQPEAAGKDRSS
jgi:hypothetical protein